MIRLGHILKQRLFGLCQRFWATIGFGLQVIREADLTDGKLVISRPAEFTCIEDKFLSLDLRHGGLISLRRIEPHFPLSHGVP